MKVKIKCSCGMNHYIKVKNIKEAKKTKRQTKRQVLIADCCMPFIEEVMNELIGGNEYES